MEDIPIFSGEKTELDSWLTCGEFIFKMETISSKNNFYKTFFSVKIDCKFL